jgi:hypothetical protein
MSSHTFFTFFLRFLLSFRRLSIWNKYVHIKEFFATSLTTKQILPDILSSCAPTSGHVSKSHNTKAFVTLTFHCLIFPLKNTLIQLIINHSFQPYGNFNLKYYFNPLQIKLINLMRTLQCESDVSQRIKVVIWASIYDFTYLFYSNSKICILLLKVMSLKQIYVKELFAVLSSSQQS